MSLSYEITVLYADDNEDSCLMLKTLLGFSGINVMVAESIAEAIPMARSGRFDLYLLDTRFPEGNGFDLCRQLRELYPDIPVIFYSGDASVTAMQRGMAAGARAYLVKPASNTIAPAIFEHTMQGRPWSAVHAA